MLVLGQFVFTLLRAPILRVAIALTFAVPAAFAGYQAAYELSGHTMTSDLWREIFAVMSSIAVGATAWARFAVLSPAAPGMFRRRRGVVIPGHGLMRFVRHSSPLRV